MKVFIAGITGATGNRLALQLMQQGHTVVALARSQGTLAKALLEHKSLTLQIGNILDISDDELMTLMEGCDAIGCCLGHKLSFKGIWGEPRMLVLDSIQRLYRLAANIGREGKPIRVVLMSSNGVANPNERDKNKLADRVVINILRHLLPPHRDNERAAEFIYQQRDPKVQWCIVRPDRLTEEIAVTAFKSFDNTLQGPIFSSGFTSRANVAKFMSQLMSDSSVWAQWQGKMPVIYDMVAIDDSGIN